MTGAGTFARALALLVFVLGFTVVTAEPSVMLGVVGALLWVAWAASRRAAAVPRTGSAPAVVVRALRQVRCRAAVPRQCDPDAAGHTRARAPSGLLPAV